MTLKDTLQQQRELTDTCLQMLLKCDTGAETVQALEEIKYLLIAANDPVAEAVEIALQASRGMDEAFILKIRDEYIGQFRDFLASTESAAFRLEAAGPAKSKSRNVWLFIAIGLAIVCICAVVAVALAAAIMAMGGA